MKTSRPTVAVIGGGQLARMLHEAASPLSINLRVLAESSRGSAALANPQCVIGLPTEPHTDHLAALINGADVLTFEHEHIPRRIFEFAQGQIPVHPSQESLAFAQDKLVMRRRLSELNIASPRWREITQVTDLLTCGEELGYPFIVKTPRGGYDGHGVLVIRSEAEARAAQTQSDAANTNAILGGGTSAKGADASIVGTWLANGSLLAEEMVNFYDELSIQIARRPSGEMATWDVVRSEQRDGVCSIVTAPAPDLTPADADKARSIARTIAHELDVTGVLAVELFRIRRIEADGSFTDDLLVNELAMRPHNSGHWTIEGAATSQFEQHLRAVLDLPLGSTAMTAPHAVMVNLLGSSLPDPTHALTQAMTIAPSAKIHLYGKDVRPGRKLGHVTVCGIDQNLVRHQAYQAMSVLAGEVTPLNPPASPQAPQKGTR